MKVNYTNEIWKWVVVYIGVQKISYIGLYKISNYGRIKAVARTKFKNNKSGKITKYFYKEKYLKLISDGAGYPIVGLWKDGKCKLFFVSRLVLFTFVGPCPKGMECCHFPNSNPTNNYLGNIRWDTHKGNGQDVRIHGSQKGAKNPRAKLTDFEVVKMKQLFKMGKLNRKQLTQKYGTTYQNICSILRGDKWNHI